MPDLRFDGRVAIVTGGARGIGQGYVRLLAERGASVIVNDTGGSVMGDGSDPEPARTAADEVTAAGGIAMPDTNDVSTEAGAQALINSALENFGRLDIVVNNAGISTFAGPGVADLADLEKHLNVHTKGCFNTSTAAWPHMSAQKYGRIVMTTSTGIFGLPENLSYATAKAGVIGMARSMSNDRGDSGIKINVIAPNASTRMGFDPRTNKPLSFGGSPPTGDRAIEIPTAEVAPVVAYLAHESCPVSGEVYVAGGGFAGRIFIAMTKSYRPPSGHLTIEDVAENWAAINDETGYHVPVNTIDASMHLFSV